jgi:hypothetical protein
MNLNGLICLVLPLIIISLHRTIANPVCLSPFVTITGRNSRIADITAILGDYEKTTKSYALQTIPADFICFMNQPGLQNYGGWITDYFPYHLRFPSPLDTDEL